MLLKIVNGFEGSYELVDGIKTISYKNQKDSLLYCSPNGRISELKAYACKMMQSGVCEENMMDPIDSYLSLINWEAIHQDVEFYPLNCISYIMKDSGEIVNIITNKIVYILNDSGKTIEIIR